MKNNFFAFELFADFSYLYTNFAIYKRSDTLGYNIIAYSLLNLYCQTVHLAFWFLISPILVVAYKVLVYLTFEVLKYSSHGILKLYYNHILTEVNIHIVQYIRISV